MTDKPMTRMQKMDKARAETNALLRKEIETTSPSWKCSQELASRLIGLGYVYPESIATMIINLYHSAKED